MDEKIDKKTEAALMKALDNAKAYGQQWQENIEKRLWKKVIIPGSLQDALSGLTKAEMDNIRRNYDFRNLSSLKKAELAAELNRLIPLKFESIIYTLDKVRYDFVKMIVENSGAIPVAGISLEKAEAFREYSIIFTGSHGGRNILFIPEELVNIFSRIDGSELEKVVQRNTEWIILAHGILYYFGVIDAWSLKERIQELTGKNVDGKEFMDVMLFACDFYGQADFTHYGFQDHRVFDARKIVEEQRSRPHVDYHHFTKKQLLRAGVTDYFDKTPDMEIFINFLLENFEMSHEETDEIALQITNMINMDAKPTQVIKYLQR